MFLEFVCSVACILVSVFALLSSMANPRTAFPEGPGREGDANTSDPSTMLLTDPNKNGDWTFCMICRQAMRLDQIDRHMAATYHQQNLRARAVEDFNPRHLTGESLDNVNS